MKQFNYKCIYGDGNTSLYFKRNVFERKPQRVNLNFIVFNIFDRKYFTVYKIHGASLLLEIETIA